MSSRLRVAFGDADRAGDPFRRMLVGVKDSAAGHAALVEGQELARRSHGCLVVVLVLTRPWFVGLGPALTLMPPGGDLDDLAIRAFHAAIDTLARDLSVTSVVCQGGVGQSLVRVAADQACDAIAIGAGRRRSRPWAGPVERYLRHYATVPVIFASCANSGSRSRGARAARLLATVDRDSVARVRDVASNSNLFEPPEVTT